LKSTDEFFVQNGGKGGKDSHVLIWFQVQKRPYEVLKTWARDHFCKFKKNRVILTQAFGQLYWKQLSDAQFEEMFEHSVYKMHGIHTQD